MKNPKGSMSTELTALYELAEAAVAYVDAREASIDTTVRYSAEWLGGCYTEKVELAEKELEEATKRHLKASKRLDAAIATYKQMKGES